MTYRAWELKNLDRAALRELTAAIAEQAAEELEYNAQEGEPWSEQKYKAVLAAQQKENALLAGVLTARGVTDPTDALTLLAGEEELSDPFLLTDMQKACERIWRAIDDGETIVVFGDYDVDGVTATALLYQHLKGMGATVKCMLPSREGDGYGLSKNAIRSIHDKGCQLIVTVDNGISAVDEADYAAELGIDLIITDHHLPPDTLPKAAAVVDPRRRDDTSPFKGLCGAGVAFKLCAALDGCPPEEMLDYCGDLAAVGTVADVMPLTGENRTLVRSGLHQLQNTDRPGLEALLEEVGLTGKPVTAENVSYAIAPRINAAGRMGKAELAAELFLTKDPVRAQALAAELCEQNKLRQNEENKILEQTLTRLRREYNPLEDKIIVLAGEGWHQGVIGIVCSRLCDRYGCPVVLISVDEDGVGKGSGRSIGSFNLFEALTSCEDLFERYGGHALAAGLTVQADRIEELRTRLRKYAETHVTMAELVPQLHIDCMVQSEWLTQENIESLSVLEPYGMKNAEPVFCMKNMTVEEITPLSSDRHVRLSLIKDGKRFSAIWFGIGAGGLGFVEGNTVDAAFHLEINEFRGRRSVQLTICDVQLSDCEHLADQKILNLYNTLMQDGPLTAREARLLLPDRKDLVAVWRHVTCRAEDGRLSVPDGALSRRVAWESRRDINIGKLFVCLDVFQESGLISYHFKEGMLNILLKPYEGKADISGSVVLATLQSMAG